MATSKRTWQRFEAAVAAIFGTKRVPLSGSNSGHNTQSDSMHPDIYIECKLRESFSIWRLFDDTSKKAKKEGKIPLVAIKEKNKKGCLFIISPDNLKELADLYNSDKQENEREIYVEL